MIKKTTFTIFGAIVIYLILMSWHEKDKKVNALTAELNILHEVLSEKEKDEQLADAAITKRDQAFEEQNKKLSAINANLRKLTASSQEMRDMLNMRIPPEFLRGLKTYSTESQTTSPGSSPARATNRK